MENQFAEFEIMLIEKEITRKSFADIAFLLDRPLEEVRHFINDWIKDKDILSLQQMLDQTKASRPPAVKRERAPREKKKNAKEKVVTSRIILPDKRPAMNGRGVYRSRVIDYSQLKTVKIDEKTYIYIGLGEDPEKVKQKYLASLTPRQFLRTDGKSVEVKKFKPIK